MPIPYSLVDNKLTTDPNDFRAQVEHNRSVTIEDLIRTISRPGSTVTVAEGLAFWEELSQAIMQQLDNGNRINSDLFQLSLGITGVFNSAADTFDPTRHHVRIRIKPGIRLRKMEPDIKAARVQATQALPEPERLEDFSSDTVNDKLTPGGTARLTGARLKFDPADTDAGIFLRKSTGAVTRVQRLMTNKPKELLFIVPAGLAAGNYQLLVRSRYKDTADLKEGALAATLTVV